MSKFGFRDKFKNMYDEMPDPVKEAIDKSTNMTDSLSKEINLISYYLDRSTYYQEPITPEHLIEIRKELRRIIRLGD